MVLRSVRTENEGAFVPHLSLSVSILLAFVCVGTLVFFVGHMAGRINVDTVIELVSDDVRSAIQRLTFDQSQPQQSIADTWDDAVLVVGYRRGYLQQLHPEGVADWAAEQGTTLRLLVRAGDYVFPATPIARMTPPVDGAAEAIRAATALGPARVSSADLEFAIRQLVEVAVRALSPGINDPYTAVAGCERAPARIAALRRHAGLVLADAEREVGNQGDLADLRQRHADFEAARQRRHLAPIGDRNLPSR